MTLGAMIDKVRNRSRADTDFFPNSDVQDLINEGLDEFAKDVHGLKKETFLALSPTFSTATHFAIRLTITGGSNALAAGDIAITHRLLEVDRIMSLPKITPEDWRADFPEFQPTGSTIDLVMNPNVMNTIMDVLKNGVNTQIADLVYKGDTLGAAQLLFTDGYSKKFKADAEVVDVANIGVITIANALDILQDITNAVPARLKSEITKMPIYMNKTTFDLLQEADRATQQNATILQQKDQFVFRSHPLKWMASMTDNELFCTRAGTDKETNLLRGVWFEGDTANFLMYREQPTHEDWLIALKFSLGFNYRTGEDVVLYVGS